MIKYVMYTLNGDYYLDKILSVILDKNLVDDLLSNYYKLCDLYLSVDPFKMNFSTGVTYREQLREYLTSAVWGEFKTNEYVQLQVHLNTTDQTMYDLFHNRNELDYWELDDSPQ